MPFALLAVLVVISAFVVIGTAYLVAKRWF